MLTITARAVRTAAGKVTLSFTAPRLAATINGSGLCTVLGFDLCDALFASDRLVQSGVENAVKAALNGASIQSAVSAVLMNQLKPLTSLRSIAMYNGNLYVLV